MNNFKNRSVSTRKTKFESSCSEQEFIVPLVGNEIEAKIRFYCENQLIKTLLDIGCGSKRFKSLFEKYGVEYFSFEVNDDGTIDYVGKINKPLATDLLEKVPYDFWRPTVYTFSYFAEKHGLKVKESHQLGSFWDMFGTLLASTNTFRIKNDKVTLKNKIINKVIVFLFNVLNKNLKDRYLHDNFDVNCYLYLSNLIVLSK